MVLAAAGARKQRKVLLLALALFVLACSHSYLLCLGEVGLTYLYWLRPTLNYVGVAGASAGSAGNSSSSSGSPQPRVPRILHQTWKTDSIPEQWRAASESCRALHPEWEYRLWTDADGRRFIEDEFPWFLRTFDSYPYAIERADVVRYFILLKLGGVYLDLDVGCNARLDFMLQHNFTAPLTHPVGISNDVMAAAPGDPYLAAAVRQLPRWNRWMAIKYVQVMFGTGPMFLTVQYMRFPDKADVGVIPASVYGKYDISRNPAFYHLHGSSWHAADAKYMLWLDAHGAVLGLALAGTVGAAVAAWAGLRCLEKLRMMRQGWLKVSE